MAITEQTKIALPTVTVVLVVLAIAGYLHNQMTLRVDKLETGAADRERRILLLESDTRHTAEAVGDIKRVLEAMNDKLDHLRVVRP